MTETPAANHPRPQAPDRQTWQAKIDELRVKEKAHTRAGDALAAERDDDLGTSSDDHHPPHRH